MKNTTNQDIYSKYPTKEQITEHEIIFDLKTIEKVKNWKQINYKNWKTKSNHAKYHALKRLITTLNYEIHGTEGMSYCYFPTFNLIVINKNNLSIISTLHEIAHSKFGESELQACRWSTQLFQKCFPREYKKLKWKNHLLVKK